MRLLIVRTGAMGDILHGMPAVTALRAALPGCTIGWAIEPHWSPLLQSAASSPPNQTQPLVNHVHLVPTREWKARPFSVATLRQIASVGHELRAQRYDVCVDLQGSIRSALIGRCSASKRFVGSRRPRERQARALYGERVDLASVNVIQQACELVAAAAQLDHLAPAAPPLAIDLEADAWCDQMLHSSDRAGKFILLIPGAGWGAKRWPLPSFSQLACRLREGGHEVFANGSSNAAVDAALGLAGAIPVASSLAQLIALTRRAALVIGGDTGPVHLAAALGVPVVALFGPTDPRRTGPAFPGARTAVLRHSGSVVDHGRHDATEAGLANITVDEVFDEAMRMLALDRQQEISDHG